MSRRVSRSNRSEVTLKKILSQPGADGRWREALRLGIPEGELAKCLEDIANQCLPPRPWRMRRRQVEAFAKRLRDEANKIIHLNTLHSDVLPGPRPTGKSVEFERLLSNNACYHLLLPEMLIHYANNLDLLEIGKPQRGKPKQRSPQEKLALELHVVHLILVASASIKLPTGGTGKNRGTFNGGEINLQPSYHYELAADLIQAAYDAGEVYRTANADKLRMAYHRRTPHRALDN